MKRINVLLSAIVGLALTAGASQATEDATWGQVKHQAGAAAKPAWKNDAPADDGATADLSATETRSTTVRAYPKGKTFVDIDDANDASTLHDNLKATLVISSGSVDEEVDITMTLIGNKLSDLIVAFQPGGLVFNKAAELRLQLGADLVDVDAQTLEVWHEYADGTVEIMQVNAVKTYQNGWTYLTLSVPGFSRYGLW